MSETQTQVDNLQDLGTAVSGEEQSQDTSRPTEAGEITREPKIDVYGRAYGTGRRKKSVARVWVKPGKGKVTINGVEQDKFFGRQTHLLVLNQPFLAAGRVNNFDVYCTVKGGGKSGQAGAIRHGIARALENYEPQLRPALKQAGMLTRDARMVERKKVGLHKARRNKQWAKR